MLLLNSCISYCTLFLVCDSIHCLICATHKESTGMESTGMDVYELSAQDIYGRIQLKVVERRTRNDKQTERGIKCVNSSSVLTIQQK